MSLLQKRLTQHRELNKIEVIVKEKTSITPSKLVIWRKAKETVLKEVIEYIDANLFEKMSEEERASYVSEHVNSIVERVFSEAEANFSRAEQHKFAGEIVSEILGYGPITPLLADKTVNEIMVNGHNQVYVEREGKLELTDISFRDDNHVLHIIERIVSPLGKRIDESSPLVDAPLPDGSRVNATISPVSLVGPVLTIRKFSSTPFTMKDLISFGTLSTNMATFLEACVRGRMNIIVGGGTGSGKTTTLNVISSCIPSDERIVTIEDAAELNLLQDHVITLETRPANIEGKGRISIRELVINSLRMRPDRIVVGEVRGGEALDMLQAMNTGHDGSLTTGHANSSRDLLARLETMVLMAGVELPLKAIREQVASALNLIVFQSRLRDGSRRITKITEVIGMEGDVITLQDIYVYDQQGINSDGKVLGSFKSTGILPKCLAELEAKGINLPISIFS